MEPEENEFYFLECLGIYLLTSYFDSGVKVLTCFYSQHVKLSVNSSKYPLFRNVGMFSPES